MKPEVHVAPQTASGTHFKHTLYNGVFCPRWLMLVMKTCRLQLATMPLATFPPYSLTLCLLLTCRIATCRRRPISFHLTSADLLHCRLAVYLMPLYRIAACRLPVAVKLKCRLPPCGLPLRLLPLCCLLHCHVTQWRFPPCRFSVAAGRLTACRLACCSCRLVAL